MQLIDHPKIGLLALVTRICGSSSIINTIITCRQVPLNRRPLPVLFVCRLCLCLYLLFWIAVLHRWLLHLWLALHNNWVSFLCLVDLSLVPHRQSWHFWLLNSNLRRWQWYRLWGCVDLSQILVILSRWLVLPFAWRLPVTHRIVLGIRVDIDKNFLLFNVLSNPFRLFIDILAGFSKNLVKRVDNLLVISFFILHLNVAWYFPAKSIKLIQRFFCYCLVKLVWLWIKRVLLYQLNKCLHFLLYKNKRLKWTLVVKVTNVYGFL